LKITSPTTTEESLPSLYHEFELALQTTKYAPRFKGQLLLDTELNKFIASLTPLISKPCLRQEFIPVFNSIILYHKKAKRCAEIYAKYNFDNLDRNTDFDNKLLICDPNTPLDVWNNPAAIVAASADMPFDELEKIYIRWNNKACDNQKCLFGLTPLAHADDSLRESTGDGL
jgi:hypothetical protein